MGQAGLYCVPGAIPAAARAAHSERLRRLFRQSVRSLVEEDSGCVYRFDADEIVELALFLEQERRCCPFLEFNLRIPAGVAELELRVSGPPGTPAFLEAEFGHGNAAG